MHKSIALFEVSFEVFKFFKNTCFCKQHVSYFSVLTWDSSTPHCLPCSEPICQNTSSNPNGSSSTSDSANPYTSRIYSPWSLYLPRHAAALGAGLGILPEEAVPLSLGAISLLLILLPAITRPRLAVPQGCGPTAQVVCCLELAALAGCTGLSNISLAILVTLPYLPLALLARPTQGLRKVVLVTFTILYHPLMLSGVAVLVDTIKPSPPTPPASCGPGPPPPGSPP